MNFPDDPTPWHFLNKPWNVCHVPWRDSHRCYVQSVMPAKDYVAGGGPYERCPCGGIRRQGDRRWLFRNTRRKAIPRWLHKLLRGW